MKIDFKDQVAIVTGGVSGIGAAIALSLARCGAHIVIIDRKAVEASAALMKLITEAGSKALYIRTEIADFPAVDKAVLSAVEHFGRVDILINNAGINRDGVIWKMTEEQWDEVIQVNLKGYFNFTRAVSPMFREQKSGKIVNITSINGLRGKFGQANYSAAKAGIIGLTKSVAKELGKYNVNVNAIAPGLIETDMMKTADPVVRSAAMEEIVLKRLGQPEDIANLTVFLCSVQGRHITGEVIKVDGGQYI